MGHEAIIEAKCRQTHAIAVRLLRVTPINNDPDNTTRYAAGWRGLIGTDD